MILAVARLQFFFAAHNANSDSEDIKRQPYSRLQQTIYKTQPMKTLLLYSIFTLIASNVTADSITPGTNSATVGGPPPSSMGNTPPSGGNSATSIFLTGSYVVSNTTVTNSSITVVATASNSSAVLITNDGHLILSGASITKSGNTTSDDDSNFYGLNAAVVAQNSSSLTISNSNIESSSEGSNAIFSTGTGSVIHAYNITIKTTMNSSRGLDATQMGSIYAQNATITTYGDHCGALANDRGTGIVMLDDASINTYGSGSPVVYSTGNITASNVVGTAHGSSAVVVEGANNATLMDCNLSGAGNQVQPYGVMLYQSTSGDAENGIAIFNMTYGRLSYTASSGSLFYITNTNSRLYLTNVTLSYSTNTLIKASADSWGNSGSNGGDLTFAATNQILSGNIVCDDISSIAISLNNTSSLTGSINSNNTAKFISLTIDSSSIWNVTGSSYLSSIAADNTLFTNIYGNGYDVYYLTDNNTWLGGKQYSLQNGGNLVALSASTANNNTSPLSSGACPGILSNQLLFTSLCIFLAIATYML